MNRGSAALALTLHLALLSSISFGGIPSVLPDIRDYVVASHGWITDRDFANYFAIVQMVPGPNMILMMSFIGWSVWGLPGALASAVATFAPPCVMYYAGSRLWDQFGHTTWQQVARRGLAPVTIGLVIAGGAAMAEAADTNWRAVAVTAAAAVALLATRLNPFWVLAAAGILGGLGFL
jgi:chromate transporter